MTKQVLGHIDCPTCGTSKGMRITHDKNNDPFGFCEAECGQQLRVGGDPHRVRAFVARFPWAAKPVTGTGTVPEPAPAAAPVPVPVPAPATAPKAPAPRQVKEPAPAPARKSGGWLTPLLGAEG